MNLDDAIQQLRQDAQHADLVHHAYLGADIEDSRQRFIVSDEFTHTLALLGDAVKGAHVLDVGAGIGIASYGFVKNGASQVFALEPDTSSLVGLGTMQNLTLNHPITLLQGFAEAIPLADESVDIVYARQVLHHTFDLDKAISEIHRILRPNGIFIACREHVIKNAQELERFLASHVVHQLAGGENAYRLEEYLSAITKSGLQIEQVLATFDSVINYFPRDKDQLKDAKLRQLINNYGAWVKRLHRFPLLQNLMLEYGNVSYPGNMYSFMAVKNDDTSEH